MQKSKDRKFLVTGGTGFIGAALVRRLVKEGARVRVLDNDLRGTSQKFQDISEHLEMVQGDIRNPEAVRNACKGVDTVFHLAYLNGTEYFYSHPELILDIGVKGMINVLDSCIAEGIKELFLASSSEVYQTPPEIPTGENVPLLIPDPLNPRYSYGGGKIISELMALNYGKKHFDRVVVFRPHNVIGPDMGTEHVVPQLALRMKQLFSGDAEPVVDFPIQGSGRETRAFIFIDDFIEGLMLLLRKGQHLNIYHVGTMEEVTIESVAREVASYYGRTLKIIPGELTKGSTLRRCPDIAKMKSLGFNPTTTFAQAIRQTTEWYASHAVQPKSISTQPLYNLL